MLFLSKIQMIGILLWLVSSALEDLHKIILLSSNFILFLFAFINLKL